MNTIATYTAVYRRGTELPVALFLNELDALEWHDNPELYSNARRRVQLSPSGEPRAVELLRAIVLGDDAKMFGALEQARQFLK